MPKKMADELEKRADSMHISKSKYCKIVLRLQIFQLKIGRATLVFPAIQGATPFRTHQLQRGEFAFQADLNVFAQIANCSVGITAEDGAGKVCVIFF
jgi:hypothetical protein